ncbi:MAG: polysaccharide biosynthesis protein [Lactobacillus sp.]|jgi:O-antigen/teichoic acid export membrane protein|nr:polysaccharide biosynthesis protein [Lactobacillus sp.]
MKRKILTGTIWMSFGSIFSRVLGVIYIIPWLMMLGSKANQFTAQALFNTAYVPYSLFLLLGTSGFPSAISRKIAIYNAQNRFFDSRKIFRHALTFMTLSGLTCGLLFFVSAPIIAANSPIVDKAAATVIIRALVPALIILPVMSVVRGWFQGFQDMKPFGVSQFIEQLARIIFILLATYIGYQVLNGSLTTVIALSTFAAFIGAIASLIYLYGHYRRQEGLYTQLQQTSLPLTPNSTLHIFKTLFQESLPFIFVGSAIMLNQLLDQFTFKQILTATTNLNATAIQNMFTQFSANPGKITAVIISLALAISETSLPILAGAQGNHQQEATIIEDNFRLLLIILTPVVVTLALLAGQINTIFFGFDSRGGDLMGVAIAMSFVLSLCVDALALLQSLGKHRLAVYLVALALVLKAALQYPCVRYFKDYGALYATAIAFGVPAILGIYYLLSRYSHHANFADIHLILKVNGLYLVGVVALNFGFQFFHFGDSKLSALLFAAGFSVVALAYYWLISSKFGLLRHLFPEKS